MYLHRMHFKHFRMRHYASAKLIACTKCPKNNHLKKPICQAAFLDPGACFENAEHLPGRGLKQKELLQFGVCNCVQEHHNIILLGAAGSGKTYPHITKESRQNACSPKEA